MNAGNDLTTGVIWKRLVLYFLPIVAGTLFQQLYNAVDAIVVGKFVGTEALAAVGGSPATLSNLLIGFFVALSGGACVVIAQHFGAKRHLLVSREIHTSITFCLIVGVLLSVIVISAAPALLHLLKTPADTFEQAVEYTRIYFTGCIFMLLFNMGSGILRALGESRRPFFYLTASCIINIILDLVFVIACGWGVAGVAWATVIAQAVSAVMVTVDLCLAKKEYRLRFRRLGINFPILGNMMKIGIPSGLQSSMYGLSNMILQVGVNTLGTVVVASWAMSGKLDGIYWATASAFGTAVMNFVGQNFGAGRQDRIKQCVKTSFYLFTGITVFLSTLIMSVAIPVLHVFTNDQAVIDTTWKIITYFVPTYLLWTIIEVISGVLRGMGDAIKPMIIIALGVCLVRVIWVLTVFQLWRTLFIISICYPISWGVTDVALIIYYFKGSAFAKKKESV